MKGYLQYCGDYSVQWGDNISTVGIASVLWRVFSTLGVTSVHAGDNISTVRDNISTVEGIQYSGILTFNDRDPPWMTREIKTAIKRKHRVYTKFNSRGRNPAD